MNRLRQRRTAIFVVLIVAAIGAALSTVREGSPECSRVVAEWRAQLNDTDFSRKRHLGERIVDCDPLTGRTSRAVVTLLGPPADGGAGQPYVSYSLGLNEGLPPETVYLNVDFDDGDRVNAVEVR